MKDRLSLVYSVLYKIYGPQKWWPADSVFEVIVGAILTQNTSWKNVERAIANLKSSRNLSPERLRKISIKKLASIIKPSGYHNVKAKRLKNFIKYLFKSYKGSLNRLFSQPIAAIRQGLLSVNGIGPETADSIILYAAKKPVFVIDAYTKRILFRCGIIKYDLPYEQIQAVFHKNLPMNAALFNEYHALIVEHGKNVCKTKPLCCKCALRACCAGE
ncbi:MAG: endonuclease III domain-containing protein [Candidatus Omnitrophica bacterium]|nr:endonuclease III domain-containing protein [Candidatus Omnitrophota bacterium]